MAKEQTFEWGGKTYSPSMLAEKSISQLLNIHNKWADELGEKVRKSFKDKPTAVARTFEIAKVYAEANPIPTEEEKEPAAAILKPAPIIPECPTDKIIKPIGKEGNVSTDKRVTKKAMPMPHKSEADKFYIHDLHTKEGRHISDRDIIRVRINSNPILGNTLGNKMMAILMNYDGKTVGEFKAEENFDDNQDLSHRLYWPRMFVRFAAINGWIWVEFSK